MILCRVLGNVVASAKHPSFEGRATLIVQPLDKNGDDKGESFLSMDAVQAGPGDVVLVSQEGNTAREILGDKDAPLHSVILAVVDNVVTAN